MFEPLFKLKIKSDAGVEEATLKIKKIEQSRVVLPLQGIGEEQICISLTDEFMSNVQSVKTVYQNVTKKNKVQDMILLDAYHSATIEGARTTVEHVKQIFADPQSKDDKMVINSVKGCDYAYQNVIDEKNIRTLWEIVVDGVCENEAKAGKFYRDGMVYIGSESKVIHVPADFQKIEGLMSQLFLFLKESTLDEILKAFVMHFYFVYVHPFCDGNGRTARILTSSYLYHKGYEKMMYLPLSKTINENLSGYYGSIKDSEWKYDEQIPDYLDITPFVAYMLEMLEKCIVTSILEENELGSEQKLLLLKMKKRGAGAEITKKNAQRILDMPETEAEKILQSLEEMGYLKRKIDESTEIYILR